MFKRSQVCSAMVVAFGGVLALSAAPSFGQTQLERVEITGSRIKRIDGETASPVQVLSRQEIERTGAANVNEVLQRITGAGGTLDDRFTNGFAPGGGGLNLRSLGFNSTLVLVNGRRLPTYPFAQQVGTAQGFNDLQNIPLAAVDRIEVLKDGASAIYGADAVAGVVNIILRSDYRGFEVGANVGQSSRGDGTTYGSSLVGGFGALESDRYNVLFGVNLSKAKEVLSSNRPWGYTEDLRSQGGRDLRSSYGFPGTITDNVTAAKFYGAGCGPSTQQGGSSIRAGRCRYDRPQLGSILPENERGGLYGKLSFAVSPDITAFAEGLFTRNKFSSTSWPAGSTDDVGLGSNMIPAGSPANPFPNVSEVRVRFADVGNRGNQGTSDMSRLVLGAKGTTAGWDWEGAFNFNKVKINNVATNNALNSRTLCLTNPAAAAIYAAGGDPGLGGGTLDQIFAANPADATYFKNQLSQCAAAFAKYGYYNYQNPSLNTAGTAAYLRHDSPRVGDSSLSGFDIRVGRELMTLPGGPLAIALGFETRKEKVSDVPDKELQTGDTLSISAAQAFGDRKVSATYAELNAPITKELEINGAVRYDKYSGNGNYSSVSPKLGIRYQPFKSLLLRATSSKAYRAPSLFETSPAQQTSFAFSIQDPVLCPTISEGNADCAVDVRRVQQGNPNLQPEISRSYTLGFVVEPSKDVTVSVDAWRINRRNEIGSFADQLLVNLFATNPNIVVRDAGGHIVQVNQVPVQLNATRTWGVDTELSMRTDLGAIGKLTSKLAYSKVGTYKFSTLDNNGTPVLTEYNGTYNQPRWRANWDFSLSQAAFEYSLGGYMVGSYDGLGLTGEVPTMHVWNAGLAFKGIKNFTVGLQVNNLFDQGPRFNDETSGANAGYNPQFGDPMGRYFKLTMTYKFF